MSAPRRQRKGATLFEPVVDPDKLVEPLCRFCGKRCGRNAGEAVWRCPTCDASQAFDPETRKPKTGFKISTAQAVRNEAKVAFNRIVLDRVFRSDVAHDAAWRAGIAWLSGQLNVLPAAIDFRTMDPKLAKRITALCGPLWSLNKKAKA